MKSAVRIGNGQGFWGDSIDAPVRMVEDGPLDYLTLDYLAEVTMSIMQRQRRKNSDAGYARDFPELLRRIMPVCVEKGIRIVTNAGGVNADGCLAACRAVLVELGLGDIKIGVVQGDDILPNLDMLIASGAMLENMDTGRPITEVRDQVLSANAYLDSFTIAEALSAGAQIVLTGRTTDPGLTLGPCIYEFGWERDQWDLLAAGTVAGHILECGAQATGGNFTRWWEVPDMAGIGYPVAEVRSDGSIVITKHENTGGLVSIETVAEQLLYELGRPTEYITPDVVVDFTSIKLEQDGIDRVAVSGVKGKPATDTFKVSINYSRGWKASGQLSISGPRAKAKAKAVVDIIFQRLADAGYIYEDAFCEIIGQERDLPVGDTVNDRVDTLVLVVGVKDSDREKVERFGKELAPVITSGPPGVTGFAGGRPKAQEVVAFWPALLVKNLVSSKVTVE